MATLKTETRGNKSDDWLCRRMPVYATKELQRLSFLCCGGDDHSERRETRREAAEMRPERPGQARDRTEAVTLALRNSIVPWPSESSPSGLDTNSQADGCGRGTFVIRLCAGVFIRAFEALD